MASDVMFEAPKMFGEFDSNGEIFMTGGVMDPKELYLSGDLKDTKDSTSSSSDSGISNLDDVADYDNVTDLQLDAEFKDLDFTFDIDTVIKEENFLFDAGSIKLDNYNPGHPKVNGNTENFFNADNIMVDASGNIIIKSEPLSPSSSSSLSAASSPLAGGGYGCDVTMTDDMCGLQEQPISPDFYTVYDDGSLLDPDSQLHSSLIFSPDIADQQQPAQQLILQQPLSESKDIAAQLQTTATSLAFSPHTQHGCIIQPATINGTRNNRNAATTQHQQYSVLSASTPPLSPPGATTTSPNSLPGQVIISPKSIATVITAPKFTQQQQQQFSSANHKNIVIRPTQIKQEMVLSPSSPSSPLSTSSMSPPLLPPSSISIPMSVSSASSLLAKPSAAINLSAILSSKKKIQPKPDLDNVATTNQWLTSQVPLTTQTIPVTPGPAISSANPLVSPGNCTLTSINDSKSMKRAQRIIKNRESASLSRKRKKEYLSSLEERLQQCTDENRRLHQENIELKQQLESILTVNTQLKNPGGLSPAKKICLMCFALFLTINISGFSLLSSSVSNFNPQTMGVAHHGTGRQLLSMSASDGRDGGDNDVISGRLAASLEQASGLGRSSAAWLEKTFGSGSASWSQQNREMLRKVNWTQATQDMCAMVYINATESIRLAEQLTGWMQEEEKKRKKKEEKKKMGNNGNHNDPNKNGHARRPKHYPTLRRFASATVVDQPQQQQQQQGGFQSTIASREINSVSGVKSSFAVQVFNGPDQRQQFLNSIPRRNDTFYVLSFSTDYLLVPASAHNKTMRPRMSLLMPVLSPNLNDSMKAGEESVAMMQIDCEILNTNVIHVHRSAFPKEPTLNATSFGKEDDSPPTGSAHDKDSHSNKTQTDNEKYWARLKGSRK